MKNLIKRGGLTCFHAHTMLTKIIGNLCTQEILIYIVCLSVELTSNNFPFFTKGLNFTTP